MIPMTIPAIPPSLKPDVSSEVGFELDTEVVASENRISCAKPSADTSSAVDNSCIGTAIVKSWNTQKNYQAVRLENLSDTSKQQQQRALS